MPARPRSPTEHGRRQFLLRAVFGLVIGLDARPAPADQPVFRVIVHDDNALDEASRSFIADAFLKRVSHWGDGKPIRPVDLPPGSAVRKRFSRVVLKKSVAAVRSYWQQRIFSGRGVPPPELDSDREVLAYVRRHRGAIGYVSGALKLEGVHELRVH